jgi:hypothetical protein
MENSLQFDTMLLKTLDPTKDPIMTILEVCDRHDIQIEPTHDGKRATVHAYRYRESEEEREFWQALVDAFDEYGEAIAECEEMSDVR